MILANGAKSMPSVDVFPPVEVREAFVSNLRKAVGELAEGSATAIAYLSPAGIRWVVPSKACPCSQIVGEDFSRLHNCHADGRRSQTVPLWYKHRSAGALVVCCDGIVHPALAATVCKAAVSTMRQVDLEKENELLRGEHSEDPKTVAHLQQLQQEIDRLVRENRSLRDEPRESPETAAALQRLQLENEKLRQLAEVLRAECKASHEMATALREVQTENETFRKQTETLRAAHSASQENAATLQQLKVENETYRQQTEALRAECNATQETAMTALQRLQTESEILQRVQQENEKFRKQLESHRDGHSTNQETAVTLQRLQTENETFRKRTETLLAEHNQHLTTAAHIQQSLLLGRPTVDLKSQLRADAVSIPSLCVGGDFYDFFAYDQVLDVVIGDVMGKGVQGALLGAATKYHFLRAIYNLYASNPARLPEPQEILASVAAEVYGPLSKIESYVTLCYARFDLRERRAHIIDCGHPRAVQVRNDGTCNLLQGENVPLGWIRADDYKGFTVPFDVGDAFFFYTDGVTEAHKETVQFGEQRVAELVQSLHRLDPRELVERVSAEVMIYSGARPPQDDLTCVAVQILDPNRSRGALRDKIDITSDLRQVPHVMAMLRDLCQKSPDLTTFTTDLAPLQQAVSEVLKYIAEHAYSGRKDMMIRIEASLFVNRFSVRIYHRGEGFDFETAKPLEATQARVDKVECNARGEFGEHYVFLQKWLKQ